MEDSPIERIVDTKFSNGKTLYLIKWRNFDDTENTWEYQECLLCEYSVDIITPLIDNFHSQHATLTVKQEPEPEQADEPYPEPEISQIDPQTIRKRPPSPSREDPPSKVPALSTTEVLETSPTTTEPPQEDYLNNKHIVSPEVNLSPAEEKIQQIPQENYECIVCHQNSSAQIQCKQCKSSYHKECISSYQESDSMEWKCFFCFDAPYCKDCNVEDSNPTDQCNKCLKQLHVTCLVSNMCTSCARVPDKIIIESVVPTESDFETVERLFLTTWVHNKTTKETLHSNLQIQGTQQKMYVKGFFLYHYFPCVLELFCGENDLNFDKYYRHIITYRNMKTPNEEVCEDKKFYLVKKKSESYRQCFWKAGEYLSSQEIACFEMNRRCLEDPSLEHPNSPLYQNSYRHLMRLGAQHDGFILLDSPRSMEASTLLSSFLKEKAIQPILVISSALKMDVWLQYLHIKHPRLRVVLYSDDKTEQDIIDTFEIRHGNNPTYPLLEHHIDVLIVSAEQIQQKQRLLIMYQWGIIITDLRSKESALSSELMSTMSLRCTTNYKVVLMTSDAFPACFTPENTLLLLSWLQLSTERNPTEDLFSRVYFPLTKQKKDKRIPIVALRCPLTKYQLDYYVNSLQMLGNDSEPSKKQLINTASTLSRLQKICNYYPAEFDNSLTTTIDSGKLYALSLLLEKLRKEKTLILLASQTDEALKNAMAAIFRKLSLPYHSFLEDTSKTSAFKIGLKLPRNNVIILGFDDLPDMSDVTFDAVIIFDVCVNSGISMFSLAQKVHTNQAYSVFQLLSSYTIEEFAVSFSSSHSEFIAVECDQKGVVNGSGNINHPEYMRTQIDTIFDARKSVKHGSDWDTPWKHGLLTPFRINSDIQSWEFVWNFLQSAEQKPSEDKISMLLEIWHSFVYNPLHMEILSRNTGPTREILIQKLQIAEPQAPWQYI